MSNPVKELRIPSDVAEFMLDLPTGTQVIGASFSNGTLVLHVESDHEFPDVAELVYDSDSYGNVALVGAKAL
jgi:hypothetical protein